MYTCSTDMLCLPLAQAYIPNQPFIGLVPLDTGFSRGSMFPNLYDPYTKRQDGKRRGYHAE